MPTPVDKPKRRWRLPRWTMKTMFVGVTIVCVWFGLLSQSAKEQKRAVEALREFDGVTIAYDYEVRVLDNGYWEPIPKAEFSPPGPAWLSDLIGIDYFADVVYFKDVGPGIHDDDDLRRLQHYSENVGVSKCDNPTDVFRLHA